MIHMEILGTHIFVINKLEPARELFEKRSRIYSDKYDTLFPGEYTSDATIDRKAL